MSARPIHNNHYAVVNPALVFFQGLKRLERAFDVLEDFLLNLVKSQIQSLQLHMDTLLTLDQQEALDLMATFDEEYNSTMAEAEEFLAEFKEKEADMLEMEIAALARELLRTHQIVLTIAEGGAVDEDSPEYGNFIADMAREAIAEKKPTYGRKALFDLLND